MSKYFTVAEANTIITLIRPLIREMLGIRQGLIKKRPELWPTLVKALGNGGSKAASEAAMEFAQLETILRQILATGAQVKDLNTGLVDFLSQRDGRDVLLCWQYGEDQIRFWHELDAGAAGRQPL